jgi:hypothetical protein
MAGTCGAVKILYGNFRRGISPTSRNNISNLDDVGDLLLHTRQIVIQNAMERLRLLNHWEVATAIDHVQPGPRGRGAKGFPTS